MFCCSTKKQKKPLPNVKNTNHLFTQVSQSQQLTKPAPPKQKIFNIYIDLRCDNQTAQNSILTNQKPVYQQNQFKEVDQNSTNLTSLLPNSSTEQPLDSSKNACIIKSNSDMDSLISKIKSAKNLSFQQEAQYFQSIYNNQNLIIVKQKFIISKKWLEQYKNYLSQNTQNTPGPVQNEDLILEGNKLKPSLKPDEDYIFISQKIYGGGPSIVECEEEKKSEQEEEEPCRRSSQSSLKVYLNNSVLEDQYVEGFLLYKHISERTIYLKLNQMAKKDLPNVGLKNPRYYCYINSVLQCLMGIGQLNAFFVSIKSTLAQNKNQYKYLQSYYDFIYKVSNSSSQNAQVYPSQLISLLGDRFSSWEQHDSQEVLLHLLDKFQCELKQPKIVNKEPTNSEEAFQIYCQNNQTIIDELFSGQMISSIICKYCKKESQSYEPFLDISLSIEEQDMNLDECLEMFFKDEIIDDSWNCDKCKKKSSKVKRTLKVSYAPNILILHLKRFALFPKKKKIKTNVHSKLNLNISKLFYCMGKTQQQYSLRGIIIHQGAMDAGHYLSVVKKQSKWYCFDDEVFDKVTTLDVSRVTSGYILFYEKMYE